MFASMNDTVTVELFTVLIAVGWLAVIATTLLCVGISGEVKARRFNKQDWALAEAFADCAEGLLRVPREQSYTNADVREWVPETLIEVERHFDQRTAGVIQGAVTHQMSLFGGSLGLQRSGVGAGAFRGVLSGLSSVNLETASTTRADLMSDAIFSLFEVKDESGHPDTLRVTSLSSGGVADWARGLIDTTGRAFGYDTHTGTTIANYADRIVRHVTPSDISYLSDRLHLVKSRPDQGLSDSKITIRGVPAGRGAVLATSVQVANSDWLSVFPTAFPQQWGRVIAEAWEHGTAGSIDAGKPAKSLAR